MQLKHLTSLLFLGLAAASYTLEVREPAKAAPNAVVKRSKHRPSKVKGGKKCARKGKGRSVRSTIAKRAITTFVMNQAPKGIASAKDGDILRTGDLGGCSVVVVFTPTAAYGVHVAGGDAQGKNAEKMASDAIKALIGIIPTTFSKSTAKAFMFTPELIDPKTKKVVEDKAADKLADGLDAAGLGDKLTWNNYDIGQIMKVSDADASVEVVFGKAGSYPTINAGGVCGVQQK